MIIRRRLGEPDGDAASFGHWIKLLNVDAPGTKPEEASAFDQRWARDRTYGCWQQLGTVYGFSYHSGVLVAPLRRDCEGRAHQPASSFRGALRSRAEMILRTLGGDGAACGVDAPREPCRAVETIEEVRCLCPACRVFGAAGWRAPLRVTDLNLSEYGITQPSQTGRGDPGSGAPRPALPAAPRTAPFLG